MYISSKRGNRDDVLSEYFTRHELFFKILLYGLVRTVFLGCFLHSIDKREELGWEVTDEQKVGFNVCVIEFSHFFFQWNSLNSSVIRKLFLMSWSTMVAWKLSWTMSGTLMSAVRFFNLLPEGGGCSVFKNILFRNMIKLCSCTY